MRHIVALSGGADSTAMSLRLKEVQPELPWEFVITPTGNELPDMVEHWQRLRELLGGLKPIGKKSLLSEARRQSCIPNHRMRWCTRIIKIEPFQAFMADAAPATSYVGIRADEVDAREGVDHAELEGIENRYPLVEWGWNRDDVENYLEDRGVSIPQRTDCALCFFQRLSEWWWLWKRNPEKFEEGVQLEAELGHTFRSSARDTWPAPLAQLRAEFERGRVPRGTFQQGEFFSSRNRPAMCGWCAR